jgi:hypothetical protein
LKLVLEGKIEERNFQKRKKRKEQRRTIWAGCREKLLSGSWAMTVNRDMSLQLHATGSTVVSGDYLLISFR